MPLQNALSGSSASIFSQQARDRFCAADALLQTHRFTEISQDYLLPDYLPDAKKLLKAQASPSLKGHFLGEGMLEYDGILACQVLYCADDGRLRAARFDIPFEGRIESPELSSDCVELLIPTAENTVCRMQGPRKLSLRCKAGVKAAFFRRTCSLPNLPSPITPARIAALETRLSTVPAMNITGVRETDLPLKEIVILEKNLPQIDGIVSFSALPLIEDCRPSPEGLRIRGRVDLECLYYTELRGGSEEGENKEIYTTFRKSLPLSETLTGFTTPSGDHSYRCVAFATPQTVTVSPCDDENGQSRCLSLEMLYTADARCVSDASLETVADAYSRTEHCTVTEENRLVPCYAGHFSGSFTSSENIPWKQLQGEIREVLSLQITPTFEQAPTVSRRGTALLEGSADLAIGGLDKDGSPLLLHAKVPLRLDSDIPMETAKGEDCILHLTAQCGSSRIRSEKEGIELDFETMLTAWLVRLLPHPCVRDIALSPALPAEKEDQNPGEMTLFYPGNGETLWDVAKRYRLPREAIAFENNLSIDIGNEESPLPGVLLIPQKRA